MASDIVARFGKTRLGRWIWRKTRGPVASKVVGTAADRVRALSRRMNPEYTVHDKRQTEILERYERQTAQAKKAGHS